MSERRDDDEGTSATLAAAAAASVDALKQLAAASRGIASARLEQLRNELERQRSAGDAAGAAETQAAIDKLEDARARLATAADDLGK